jgi:Ankyrin repeats (3 copies)
VSNTRDRKEKSRGRAEDHRIHSLSLIIHIILLYKYTTTSIIYYQHIRMNLRERKRPRMEKNTDVDAMWNRTLLVLYLTCVRHPYLFPLLRQVCKASRDDKELEIEFLKYSKGYKRSRDGLKYLFGRLVVYIDSLSTETLMEYIIHVISNQEDKLLISSLLNKIKGSEKHKDAFEGGVRCHYQSLEKCTEALRWACEHGDIDIVRMLLADPRVDPSEASQDAIKWASNEGHMEIVRMLLADPRVDPSADDQIALRLASHNGHTEIFRTLLADTRVDPSADDQIALTAASHEGHTEIVRMPSLRTHNIKKLTNFI